MSRLATCVWCLTEHEFPEQALSRKDRTCAECARERHPLEVPHRLAVALGQFAREHGLPNAVSPKELRESYGAPFPLDVGWHWRYNRAAVDRLCASRGVRIVGLEKAEPKGQKLLRLEAA